MSNFALRIKARLSTRATCGIALFIIFGIALTLRISLPYESIFAGGHVIFQGNDPWYHMRLVENLVHNFPHRILFDPYALYPDGMIVGVAPFFDILLASVIWVIGLGSPSQQTIETVGAYFPAIVGALVTVPVYFSGRELFNRNVGLLAAGLIAVLPGQFLLRSNLGFTDHHVAEVLFSTTAVLFLILAIKRAKEKETSFSHIRGRDWGNLKKPLIYALLTGIALGTYLITWSGGLLFVFLIFAYIIIQYIIDHIRNKSNDYLCIIGVPMFLIALIIVIPFLGFLTTGEMVIKSLIIGMLAFLGLSSISRLMAYRGTRRLYYPLALAGLSIVGVGIFYAIDPSLLSSMLAGFEIFLPSETWQTISEVKPLVSVSGFLGLFVFFTINILLAFIAMGTIIYAHIKKRSFEWTSTLLFIWSLIMLAAMLGQNRFAYYFAVNVALLSGYFCWRVLEWSWMNFREEVPKGEKGKVGLSKGKDSRRTIKGYISASYGVAGVAIIIFFVAFFPNIPVAMETIEYYRPNEAWYSSLTWMRENTPDPFGDPDFYYELYEKPSLGEGYDYPESAYGIMNWWNYGYWIIRIAQRIPNASPSGAAGAENAARFYISQDESSANEIVNRLGSRYVIIDYEMSLDGIRDFPLWAGESDLELIEEYIQKTVEGKLQTIKLYYPEYYQTMCARLYNFGGEAVVPHNSVLVISFKESSFLGKQYKEITSSQYFDTYEEAKEYVGNHSAENYRIVGDSAFISPVPIEELEHYKLVHESDPEIFVGIDRGLISFVRIFEYAR